MSTSIVIGSGPASAGAALALLEDPSQLVTILDIGGRLEPERETVRDRLASSPETAWSPHDLARIGRHGPILGSSALPQKQSYGSDFPFRNLGQLTGVSTVADANSSVVSGAYGGFSNVWGAQVMPFSAPTFDHWPLQANEMAPHYRVASAEMSLAGDADDLSALFPLPETRVPLPPLAQRTRRILERYAAHRAWVQSHGLTVGRARLAMHAPDCTLCGLCMTGCPYGLIYSASQTFDRLRRNSRLAYRGGVIAVRLVQGAGSAGVVIRDLSTGSFKTVTADRVFVGCGGLGTTRLVLGSLGRYDRPLDVAESVQFVMPAASLRPTRDPREEPAFTLNQFNVVYDASGDGRDLCQIHFYPYNELFLASLPAPLRHSLASRMTTALLRRLSVGLGYVPSWGSPSVTVVARRAGTENLPDLAVGRAGSGSWPAMLKANARALLTVAPALDLWPILPKTSVSAAAKSYHFGASFPHADRPGETTTDRLGRLPQWENIHLIDASVFPDIPATTFTLTVMANAHRIAFETLARST